MKKVSKNKRIIAAALFTVFTVALNPVAMAKNIKPTVPVELKFVGKVNEKTVFQLNFTGSPQEMSLPLSLPMMMGTGYTRKF